METQKKFIPFSINIVDVVEMFNAAMLVITGYNIGNAEAWFAISTGAFYAIGKKFVELAKAKTSTPDGTVKTDVVPTPDVVPGTMPDRPHIDALE